jgi:D-aminopeptidase
LTTTNKTTTQARDAQVIAGVTKDLKNVASLSLAGTTYTPVTLIQLVQSRITAANEVATSRANWLDAVRSYQALSTQVHAVEVGLKQYVINAYGAASPLLADFGFTPNKRTTPTTETKQLAVQKRAATRKARNTLGKKAKAKIKGTIDTPVQPAASSAPVTTPAPMTPTVNLVVTQAAAPPPAPTIPVPAPATPTAPPKS